MKKYILVFSLIIPLFFNSCSRIDETKEYEQMLTLKGYLDRKEYDTNWTTELENNRLESELSVDVEIDNTVFVSPYLLSTVRNFQNPVFPEIPDFGSLDNTNLSGTVNTLIQNFCTKLSENIFSGPEAFFKSNYQFNYIFFIEDLKKGWLKNFNIEFPQNKKLENPSNDSQEEDAVVSPEYPELFYKWNIGKPDFSENLIIVPVRFFCNAGKIDVIIYLDAQGDNHIYQINIKNWMR